MKSFAWKSLIFSFFVIDCFLPSAVFTPVAWGQQPFELEMLPNENGQNLNLWYEQIEAARLHPVALNSAAAEDLEQIPGVPKSLAEFLLAYRRKHGPFRSKSEVRQVLHLSDDDWAWFSQFITVKGERQQMGVWLRSRLSGRNSGLSLDEKLHSYQRLQFAAGSPLIGGFLLEKDPLETNWIDHAVGYLRAKIGQHVSLVAGDYFPAFGQGLLLSLPYTLGKSVSPAEILKIRVGRVRGDVSSLEDHFFRGLEGSASFKSLALHVFGAKNAWDARIDSTSGVGTLEAPVSHTGTHLSRKNSIFETVLGIRLESNRRNFSAGITAMHSVFSRPVVGLKNDWPLRSLNFLGSDFRVSYRILQVTGEWARQAGRGQSFIVGGMFETRPITWVVALRNYGERFWNPHGFVFGEQGIPQNEKGWYAGFVLKPRSGTQIRSFLDVFLFPKITRGIAPSPTGKEWGVRWREKWASSLRTFLNISLKDKTEEVRIVKNGWDVVKISARRRRARIQFFWSLHPDRRWLLKGQVQAVRTEWRLSDAQPTGIQSGFLFSEEMACTFHSNSRLSAGWALFNTSSYDSRIYAYEPGLPGEFSVKLFYGKGSRVWLGIRWKFFSRGFLSLKYFTEYRRVKPGVNYRIVPEEMPPQKGLAFQLDFHL